MIGDESTIANGAKPYRIPPWVYRPIVSFAAAPQPRRFSEEIERQLPILRDRSANACVTALGKCLAAKMPGAGFTYQFTIVNASDINAFVLPSGFMYLNRGLIEAAENEGQLAGVMAHEMSHVALRHDTNQASKAYVGQAGLGILGGLMSKEKGSPNKVISAVGGFGLNTLFLKFSRMDEEQADIACAQAMAKAGYNPQEMVDFFETLKAEQSHDPSKLEQYFSSHPAPQDRAARIRKEMAMLRIQASEAVDASNKRGIGDLGGVRRGAQSSADQPVGWWRL